jgi:hypothetical protein
MRRTIFIGLVLLGMFLIGLVQAEVSSAGVGQPALQLTSTADLQITPSPTAIVQERERSPVLLLGALLIVAVILLGAGIAVRRESSESS